MDKLESQNNFKIWRTNQLLLGLGLETSSTTDQINNDWRCLGELIGIPMSDKALDVGRQDVLDFVIQVTTEILVEDEFLNRLLQLQQLDLLDTDGAMAVYHRLLELCHNNESLAESYVDAPIVWMDDVSPTDIDTNDVTNTTMNIPRLLKDNPIKLPKVYPNIVKLCNEVDAVKSLLQQSATIALSYGDMDAIRRRAQIVINELSIEECCYLLQSWLLSLSMCDVTFFINYHFVPTTNVDPGTSRDNYHRSCHHNTTNPSRFRILSVQSKINDATPGRIEYYNNITNEYQHIQYQIKVIDIDRKPANKIRSRNVKERQFDNIKKL